MRIGRRRRRSTQTPAGRPTSRKGSVSMALSKPTWNGCRRQHEDGRQGHREAGDLAAELADGLGRPELQEVGVAPEARHGARGRRRRPGSDASGFGLGESLSGVPPRAARRRRAGWSPRRLGSASTAASKSRSSWVSRYGPPGPSGRAVAPPHRTLSATTMRAGGQARTQRGQVGRVLVLERVDEDEVEGAVEGRIAVREGRPALAG